MLAKHPRNHLARFLDIDEWPGRARASREAEWLKAVAAVRLLALTGGTVVLKAIQEFDRFGRESFLDEYGFGHAKLLNLRLESDCRRTHQYAKAGPGPLKSFSGVARVVRPVLDSLGFTARVDRAGRGNIGLPGEADDDVFDPSNIEGA